jgi:L-fuconolactonase
MIVVDAHQHFWDPIRNDYGWLTPSNVRLYRRFGPENLSPLLAEAGAACTVLVQAAASEDETKYLISIATRHKFVAGVVGWVDFEADDVDRRIAALVALSGGRLKGLRPMIQDIPDVSWLAHRKLDPAFRSMIQHGLTFDALVMPRHLSLLRDRLRMHPKLRAVLNHAGKPDIAGGDFDGWAADIERLARDTGVCCKLSGLLTQAALQAGAPALSDFVAHIFRCFGSERVMWGSDWPVLTTSATYGAWLKIARTLVDLHAAGSEQAVFRENAVRFYSLDQPEQGHFTSSAARAS